MSWENILKDRMNEEQRKKLKVLTDPINAQLDSEEKARIKVLTDEIFSIAAAAGEKKAKLKALAKEISALIDAN